MKPETLSKKTLNRALLARQMLLAREEISALRAIERVVGLQAQQPRPPFVALWTRVRDFERDELLRLLQRREAVRSLLLRGTLHLTSTADFLSLRGVLQAMLSAGMRAVLRERAKALDIPALVAAARQFFGERPRTFTELRAHFAGSFGAVDERAMGYAVRTHLPLVIEPDDSVWGFRADPRFAVAELCLGRVPDAIERPHDLVMRYLAAHGPATPADVQAFSGLSGVRDVMEELRPRLVTFRDERKRELFDLPESPRPSEDTPAPVRFLAGFDNVILAHADRSRIIADEHRPRVTTKNLLVLPTFLVDGFVAGTWKSSRVKGTAALVVSSFAPLPRTATPQLKEEGERLLRFLEPDADKRMIRFVES